MCKKNHVPRWMETHLAVSCFVVFCAALRFALDLVQTIRSQVRSETAAELILSTADRSGRLTIKPWLLRQFVTHRNKHPSYLVTFVYNLRRIFFKQKHKSASLVRIFNLFSKWINLYVIYFLDQFPVFLFPIKRPASFFSFQDVTC